MLQPRRDTDLVRETLGTQCRAEFRAQDLDRHAAVVLEVLGEIYRRHATSAELALDAVAVGEG